jgi:hypothetical protein
MKLLLNVAVKAHCPDALNIAGTRAKTQTIEHVQNALFLCQTLRPLLLLRVCRRNEREHAQYKHPDGKKRNRATRNAVKSIS